MSMNEYVLCCQGYFIRLEKSQQPFRRIYQLVYNYICKSGHELNSMESLNRQWPLPRIDKVVLDVESYDRRSKWDRAKEVSKKMREKNGSTDIRD